MGLKSRQKRAKWQARKDAAFAKFAPFLKGKRLRSFIRSGINRAIERRQYSIGPLIADGYSGPSSMKVAI